MWINFKRSFFYGLIFFFIIFLGSKVIFPLLSQDVLTDTHKSSLKTPVAIVESPQANITLAFVGDIMLDRGVKSSVNKNLTGDYSELFSKVKGQLQNYDFLFGNLEGPVSDKGVDGGNIYSFRMDPPVIPVLKDVGFDAFSLDNNHILNYGLEALIDTKIRLKGSGLSLAGESFVLDDVKIITLSFNQFANLDLDKMKQEISSAKLDNDLVLTYFHFGDEYEPEPNEYQKNVAKLAIEAGADLVVGAHPHVVQTLEYYKNAWIAYSLGNFIFDQYFSKETMTGGLLEVEINTKTKQIGKVNLRKVNLNSFFQIETIE
jgi:poly-gamma-glutamate synthesis protein (capsule biosynthesis protein)